MLLPSVKNVEKPKRKKTTNKQTHFTYDKIDIFKKVLLNTKPHWTRDKKGI
jgi:hypothetical protein